MLVSALFDLPKQERQLFARVVTDGADPAALAELYGTTHAEIDALVHATATTLAAAMPRLTQGDTGTVRALYQELGDTLRGLPRH